MPPAHQLNIFGAPALLDPDGRPVRFRTGKQLALLVYLTLEARDRPVSRDALIDLLWPDVPDKRGRHSLSQGLTAIRQKLGADALTRGGANIRLTSELETDLDHLLAGAATPPDVAQPLEELEKCGGASFAHWLDRVRSRCHNVVRQHLLEQLGLARSGGDLKRVHEHAATLYTIDPVCDTAAYALAERSLLAGDAVGAIRLLREHLERANEELDFNPHPEVKRLLRRLETGRVPSVGADQEPQPVSPQSRSEVLIGREAELAQLEAVWTEARGGELRMFLVSGAAGIGKSSLVRQFATSVAARAWPVCIVGCQEIGRSIPFAAISDLIYGLSRDPSISGTDPQWLAEASRVTPGLRAVYPGIPDPPPAPAESVRVRVADAIRQMLDALTEGSPVLLVFDDFQHIDSASCDILHLLLRRLQETAALLIACVRSDEHRRLAFESQALGGISWDSRTWLDPLPLGHSMALIRALASSEVLQSQVRRKIARLAQGNPYLIEMLVSDWQRNAASSLVAAELSGDAPAAHWEPPETMRKAFARQYHGLTRHAERLVNLLAVAGRSMPNPELGSLLGLGSTAVDQAAVEGIERGIVHVESAGFVFKNELHRAFVYYVMSDDSRRYYHQRLGESFAHLGGEEDFQRQLEASHHFVRGGTPTRALGLVTCGSELAIKHGAPQEAQRALEEIVKACGDACGRDVHLLLAKSLVAQGKFRSALPVLDSLEANQGADSDTASAMLLRAQALHLARTSSHNLVIDAARHAVAAATEARDNECLLNALQLSAEVASDVMDFDALQRVAARALRIIEITGDDSTQSLARLTLAYCLMASGNYGAAAENFTRTATSLRALSRDIDLRRTLNGLGMCYSNMGELVRAEEAYREALSIAMRIGNDNACCNLWSNLAVLYEDFGRFNEAAEASRAALRHSELQGTPRTSAEVLPNVANLSMMLGNLAEAAELLDKAEEAAAAAELLQKQIDVVVARADLHIARREYELAWPFVERALKELGDRTLVTGDTGRLERAKRHFVWATQGYGAMKSLPRIQHAKGLGMRLAQELEIAAFEEWVARVEGIELDRPRSPIQQILEHRFFGVIARLCALHTYPGNDLKKRPEESPVELVVRSFDNCPKQPVPHSVVEPRRSLQGDPVPTLAASTWRLAAPGPAP